MVRTKNPGIVIRERASSDEESSPPTPPPKSATKGKGKAQAKGKAPAVAVPSSKLPPKAQRRLDDAIAHKKNFIPERGIPVLGEEDPNGVLSVMAADRGWGIFCAPRAPAVVPLVREFYAVVPDHKNGQIRLRGVTFGFHSEIINGLFGLTVPDVDEYAQLAESCLTEVQAEAICQELTAGKGRWETSGGKFVSLKRKHLTPDAKAWYYYIVFNMMPVTHHNLCRRDPAILLYAIMRKMSIDVGQIIFRGILASASASKGYWFPSLITFLCRCAGVPIGPHEEIIEPGTLMTHHYITRLCVLQGRRSFLTARQLRARADADDDEPSEQAAPDVHEDAPATHSVPGPSVPAPPDTAVLQLLRQMQRENRQTRREFRLRHEHIDENLRRHDDNLRLYWSTAGYDISQYQGMIPWEHSDQAVQWAEQVEEEADEEANQDSSAEE